MGGGAVESFSGDGGGDHCSDMGEPGVDADCGSDDDDGRDIDLLGDTRVGDAMIGLGNDSARWVSIDGEIDNGDDDITMGDDGCGLCHDTYPIIYKVDTNDCGSS